MINSSFVKYKDLIGVNKIDEIMNEDKFVKLPKRGKKVLGKYMTDLNDKDFSNDIMLRETVYRKLLKVNEKLKEINNNYQLIVVYGYRALNKKKKYFEIEIDKAKDKFDNQLDLYEYVHEKIAVPTVAGHPAGGAVDIVIYDNSKKKIIDFGCDVHDFSTNKCYTFYEKISELAKENRMLLRKLMCEEGFAPYDGEWWHFSYGDKEWAFYYKKEKYLYDQVGEEEVYG